MKPDLIPLDNFQSYPEPEMLERAREFYELVRRRRTVRDFSDRPVDRKLIETCILAGGTAPNGANQQPWHFAVVTDPEIKSKIRSAAEKEEQEFYNGKAPQAWLDALAPIGTDANKPFLETAPCLIVIFARSTDVDSDGNTVKQYYSTESTGIATGMLINALHHSGLATLTHTPSPMKFLNETLERPKNERPFVLLVVGHPAPDARVPNISKKSLEQITSYH